MRGNPAFHCTPVQGIDPDAYAAGTYTKTIDCRGADFLEVVLAAGALGSSATLDCKLQEGDESDGSDAADITGAAFTQMTQAGGDSDSVAQGVLFCPHYKRYITISMTVAVATSDCAVHASKHSQRAIPDGTDPDFNVVGY